MNTYKKQNAMKTRTRSGVSVSYGIFLNKLRAELYLTNVTSLQKAVRNKAVDISWCTFLIKVGAVSKNANGFYKWNEEFKVDGRLITAFRKYKHAQNNKRGQQLDAFKPIKTRTPKRTKEVQIEKVGLIRKFLKWLY